MSRDLQRGYSRRLLYVYICMCSYVHVNVCIHCAGGLVSCLTCMRVYTCVYCMHVYISVCTCEYMYTLRRRARFSRSTMGLFYACTVCIHMCMFMCTFECMYTLRRRARFSRSTMRLFAICLSATRKWKASRCACYSVSTCIFACVYITARFFVAIMYQIFFWFPLTPPMWVPGLGQIAW